MTWNKCTERLPEVGMLVIAKETTNDDVDYHADTVRIDRDSTPYIGNVYSGFIHFLPNSEIQWKEIEKD